MAYSEELVERIREALRGESDVREISMFGGRCFMLNGKLFACAAKEEYLFRVGRKHLDEAFAKPGSRPMVNNGRISKGFLFVNKDFVGTKEEFEHWINLCLDFNQSLTDEDVKLKEK
jgi:TfoX/Sxy family transcriptional regulator of competence genes